MPVFISDMINGLGWMEAVSTKDSFRFLTNLYVQAVNYGPSTKCKGIIEKDASTSSISFSYGTRASLSLWDLCVQKPFCSSLTMDV